MQQRMQGANTRGCPLFARSTTRTYHPRLLHEEETFDVMHFLLHARQSAGRRCLSRVRTLAAAFSQRVQAYPLSPLPLVVLAPPLPPLSRSPQTLSFLVRRTRRLLVVRVMIRPPYMQHFRRLLDVVVGGVPELSQPRRTPDLLYFQVSGTTHAPPNHCNWRLSEFSKAGRPIRDNAILLNLTLVFCR